MIICGTYTKAEDENFIAHIFKKNGLYYMRTKNTLNHPSNLKKEFGEPYIITEKTFKEFTRYLPYYGFKLIEKEEIEENKNKKKKTKEIKEKITDGKKKVKTKKQLEKEKLQRNQTKLF